MHKTILMLMTLGLALSSTGCKKSPEQTFEEVMKLKEEIAKLAEANKGDCEKMATQVVAVFEKNRASVERARQLRSKLSLVRLQAIADKELEREKATGAPKMRNLFKCLHTSEKLRAVLKALR